MMATLREWLRRLRGTFAKDPHDAEMEDELRAHLDMLADELQRRGLSASDAAREARLQAGGLAQAMEERRDQRGLPWLHDLIQDLRYGARTLRRDRGFTAVALMTLALAIGANTAIFSLFDPLLFRDLPVRDPGRLVQFLYQFPLDPPLNSFSLASYERYRDGNHVFSDVVGFAPLTPESRSGEEPINAEVVTGNFFEALGLQSSVGRLLDDSDDRAGAAPAAVVSWRYWKNHLNADPRVLGAPIDIKDSRLPVPLHATLVGVTPPAFSGLAMGYAPDVWMSLPSIPDAMRARASLSLIARLKPGTSIEQALAEMRVLDRPRIEELAQRDPQWRRVMIDVEPARTGLATPLQQEFGRPLLLLMMLVVVLLLLACANVGSLLLARAAARQQEMSIRVSLGAGRFRIVRQVFAESLLLAGMGSVLGIAGAPFGATILMRMITSATRSPGPLPRLEIPLDARVLSFTVGVTVLAALVFGLAPAVAAFASAPALRQGGGAQGRSRRRFGHALVAAQIAISLVLLSVAQLYIGHVRDLRGRSLGFDRDRVLLISVNAPRGQTRDQLAALYRTAATRLQTIPGVRSVADSATTPIALGGASRFLRVEGLDAPPQNEVRVALNWVSPNYFATYGTPLLAGRDFREADMTQPRCAIVNQAVARRYFAGTDPVGRRIWLENERDPYEIVGVVGDTKYSDIHVEARTIVYLFTPMSRTSTLSLRTTVPPAAIAADARRIVNDVIGADSVQRVTTLAEQVDAAIVPERLITTLAGFFGGVGALLAAIGLYGLLAYTVARRTREIGVRMALGAPRANVMRTVLAEALRLVAAGLLAGMLPALWSKRLAAAMLENLPAGGLEPILVAGAGMLMVALVSAYIPARRATRVEPAVALRSE